MAPSTMMPGGPWCGGFAATQPQYLYLRASEVVPLMQNCTLHEPHHLARTPDLSYPSLSLLSAAKATV